MAVVDAGRALLHAAWKRGILESEQQRDRLQAAFDEHGLTTLEAVRAWLDAGQGIDPATGRQLARCLAPADAPRLGDYRQLALLEEGGMGSVCLAADPADRLVVIKTMRRQLAGVEEYIKRFEREIAFMRELDHPSLVRCFDAGVAADGTPFLVLEFVPGGNLKQLAARRGVPEELALSMVWQVLRALDYVSERQLVHRDIKPSNIFVDGERAVLADFGLARSTRSDATSLTMEGSLVGTPHYMAPEQIQPDQPLDARCDLYALGAVLYFTLTGRDPYGGQRYEVMHAHCSAAVPEVRRVNDGVSAATEKIIVKAMQKQPGQRFPCAAAMLRAVEDQLQALGVDPAGIERRVADMLEARSAGGDPEADTRENRVLPPAEVEAHPTPVPGDATPSPVAATPVGEDATPGPEDGRPSDAAPPPEPPQAEYQPSRHSQVTMFEDFARQAREITAAESADPGSGVSRSGTDSDIRASGDTPTRGSGSATRGSSGTASFEQALEDPRQRTPRELDVEPVIGDRFEGDPAAAAAVDWLTLEEVGGERRILVWARTELVLGKMRQAPIDLCLRNYPVAVHKEACQRISRQHARLVLREGQVVLEDLGSANGSSWDGYGLMAGKPMAVAPGPEHLFVAADTVSLRIRVTHRSGEILGELPGMPGPAAPGGSGLEADHDYDAVVITRGENTPEHAYAMVLRRLSLGGPGADLLVHDAIGAEVVDVARWAGRWIHRRGGHAPGAWRPLGEGDSLVAGGRTFVARAGSYGDFH